MKVSKIIATTMLMAFASFQVQAGALQDILSNGVLKAGTTGDWNPMTMKDAATNSYTGYDIDVMTALAADMGVELEIVPTEWKTLVAGVTAGKYHMTGSASISPSRAKAAGYSISYFSLATVPLTLKSNAGKYKDWDDLNNADVRVAATLGTTQEKQVKQYFPNAKHVIVEAPAQPFQQVRKTGQTVFPKRQTCHRRGASPTLPTGPQRSGRCAYHIKCRGQQTGCHSL